MNRKIFLIGLPGTGKTTLGRELAKKLNTQFVDLDKEIELEVKQSIRFIFAEKGENHFRNLENRQLNQVIEQVPAFVLATGGGTPCFFNNMDVMNKSGETIFINTPISEIKKRVQQDSSRPLLNSNSLQTLFEKREEFYLRAHHQITTASDLFELFS